MMLLFFWLFLHLVHATHPETLPQWFGSSKNIPSLPRKSWSSIIQQETKKSVNKSNQHHFRKLSKQRQPIVVTDSPIHTEWPAMHSKRWQTFTTSTSLSNFFANEFQLTKLNGVRKSLQSSVFVYEEKNRLLGKKKHETTTTSSSNVKKITIQTKRFFDQMMETEKQQRQSKSKSKKKYYYYSHSLPQIINDKDNYNNTSTEIQSDGTTSLKETPETLGTQQKSVTNTPMHMLAKEFAPQDMFNVSYHPRVTAARSTTATATGGDTSQSTGSYLWMGGIGITASCHYDRSHNFFVQIHGQKRFYLWNPTQLASLYIYPFYHPRDRQSQFINLEWNDGNRNAYPMLSTSRSTTSNSNDMTPSFVIDLNPGDVLYIPPYWAHRVTSLTPSISVNVWSPGEELIIGTSLNAVGLPLGIEDILNTGDRIKRKHSSGIAAIFIKEIIKTTLNLFKNKKRTYKKGTIVVDKNEDEDDEDEEEEEEKIEYLFARKLYETRYAPMGHLWRGCSHFESDRCPRRVGMSEKEQKDTTSKAIEISLMFTPLLKIPNGLPIAKILMNDYIERLITFVASIDGSCGYLRCIGEEHAFQKVTTY